MLSFHYALIFISPLCSCLNSHVSVFSKPGICFQLRKPEGPMAGSCPGPWTEEEQHRQAGETVEVLYLLHGSFASFPRQHPPPTVSSERPGLLQPLPGQEPAPGAKGSVCDHMVTMAKCVCI